MSIELLQSLPGWTDVTSTPKYEAASVEDKLQAFYNWKSDYDEAFGSVDLRKIDFEFANDFYNAAKTNELQLIEDVKAGEETPWDIEEAEERFHIWQKSQALVKEARVSKTWYLDNSLNHYGKGVHPLNQRKPPKGYLTRVRKGMRRDMQMPGVSKEGELEYEAGSSQDHSDGYTYYEGDKRQSVVLSQSIRDWYDKKVESSGGSYSWVARDVGAFGDNKEINIFRSVLGAAEYAEGLDKSDVLDAEDKITALADYNHSRILAISALRGYLISRKAEDHYIEENPVSAKSKSEGGDGLTAWFLDAMGRDQGLGIHMPQVRDHKFPGNSTGDPEIYTRHAPLFHLSNENSPLLNSIRKSRALEHPEYFTDPDKFKDLLGHLTNKRVGSTEKVAIDLPADFLMDYFLPKVGMEDVVNEIRDGGPKSEAYRDSLNQLFFDALLEIPGAWREDQTAIKRDGEFIVNPTLYNSAGAHWQGIFNPKPSLTPEQFEERLEKAGMNEEERGRHMTLAYNIQEEAAEQQHLAMLGGILAEPEGDIVKGTGKSAYFGKDVAHGSMFEVGHTGIAARIGERVLFPMSRPYRVYYNKKEKEEKDYTYKELIDGFRAQLTEPTDIKSWDEFTSYVGRSTLPIGHLGQILQSIDASSTIQGIGTFFEKMDEAIIREPAMFATGLMGAAQTIFSDKDDILLDVIIQGLTKMVKGESK